MSAYDSLKGPFIDTSEEGVFVTIYEPRTIFVDKIPETYTSYASDADGSESPLEVCRYGNKYLLYTDTQWLSKASYPVTYGLKTTFDLVYCCIA